MVISNGLIELAQVFKTAFPSVTYHSYSAKRLLGKMPVVFLRLLHPSSGVSKIFVMEYVKEIDYCQFLIQLQNLYQKTDGINSKPSMSKEKLKDILHMACSDRERECIRYAVYQSSGLSAKGARKHYGLERMDQRSQKVDDVIEERKCIYAAIDEIAETQEKALLQSCSTLLDSDECTSSDSDCIPDPIAILQEKKQLSLDETIKILEECYFNWFAFLQYLNDNNLESTISDADISSRLTDQQNSLFKQSHLAYCTVENEVQPMIERDAAVRDGYVVSESDEDNPDDYLDLRIDHESDKAKTLVERRVAAIRRKSLRTKAKLIAEKKFLHRKNSKQVHGIVKEYPDIGEKIEDFVKSRSIGADAWRRTGVLTFDGNKQVKEKVTYERIKLHLEEVYQRNFAYGTVVQLCCARNKRRLSASRYKGVAQVTSRRSRKGFEIKYNPDHHWSAAFYRGLTNLQFTDGKEIMNLNRDDASGFRLDTLSTHRLHRSPVVKGHDLLTTHTDYVNSYPSILQTTCYNFSATKTTGELCAGVVKAAGIYEKNPAQHYADLEMLEKVNELQPAFINVHSNTNKKIECVRVDGAADEGPSHVEVQFWWCKRHLEQPTHVTLVTARNSGASYMNRVELQNGCLALAHANLFIPSNLNGSCFNPDTGKLDADRLSKNMTSATDLYIERVNGAPCGSSKIQLYPGADSLDTQKLRKNVLIYLKGNKVQKEELKKNSLYTYEYIETVWSVRLKHGIPNLPVQYCFMLKCCYKPSCPHPFCCVGDSQSLQWFPGGPDITFIPLPIPDPDQPWGSTNCKKCDGTCYGHFLNISKEYHLPAMSKPPSVIMKEAFQGLNGEPSPSFIAELAKKCLLPPDEVSFWIEHLQQIQKNRKRGAVKAAATRRLKKQATLQAAESGGVTENSTPEAVFCSVCGDLYEDLTDEVENWIGCDNCTAWFHFGCAGITVAPDVYLCYKCVKN